MTIRNQKFLIFTISGRRYAFDLAQVAEVEEPQVTWPIPGAPASYAGAMNFHGTIVAVMDLAAFMGLPQGHGQEKIIVLDAGIAALAFLVEKVERIVPAGQVQFGDPIQGDDARFAARELTLADGVLTLLDAGELARVAAEIL